jgi:hypothetical protein
MTLKLLGVHGFRLKKLAAVTSALGLRGMGCEATEPRVERRRANVVPKLSNASCPYAQVCVCAMSRCVLNGSMVVGSLIPCAARKLEAVAHQ